MAIIDSGVNPAHPHVGGVAGGARIGSREESDDYLDYLGHGTAVAGAIREKAPRAELFAVKVFDHALRTSIDRLLRAIEWAAARRVQLINLSLATKNPAHRGRLEEAVAHARAAGAVLIAPHGTLDDGFLAVEVDWECPREQFRRAIAGGRERLLASGYPRPIPGRPVEANLSGISFAVANMTGFAARACEGLDSVTLESVQARLASSGKMA
ncbi:MAG: S8 family serine peptidase [Bryobacteraceae bacterium]